MTRRRGRLLVGDGRVLAKGNRSDDDWKIGRVILPLFVRWGRSPRRVFTTAGVEKLFENIIAADFLA